MKRFVITLLSILLCILLIRAELLWQVSAPGIARPTYLFGTHHVAPVDMLDSIAGFDEALAGVDAVYGELVMTDLTSPDGQRRLLAAATAPADSTLSRVLTSDRVDSLNVVLAHYFGPQTTAAMFARLKPAMLQTMIAMAMSQEVFPDFDPNMQLDGYIQRMAADESKTVGALETIDDQCDALFGNPVADQAADLMMVVRDIDRQKEMSQRLADIYLAGDLDALFGIMLREMDDATATRLIYSRNYRWVDTIAARIAHHPTMYVVGAGHLAGHRGLIQQLRDRGFNVTPVNNL